MLGVSPAGACCAQNLSGSNIGEDASNVRNNLRALALTEINEKEREAGRTEVLPVQWRKHLNLDVRPSPTTDDAMPLSCKEGALAVCSCVHLANCSPTLPWIMMRLMRMVN